MRSQPRKHMVYGQPSWRIFSDSVEAYVTEQGGHLGPVTFNLRGKKVQPYSIAPWAGGKKDRSLPPLLQVLRGDFFCLPFGANTEPFQGERHPPHGETANSRWVFRSLEKGRSHVRLHLSLKTRVREGWVDKRVFLLRGHQAVYCQHVVSGMKGPMSLGHHAMLKFPDEPGSGVVSSDRFCLGQVFPGKFELPEKQGYSQLLPGAKFSSLQRVPSVGGMPVDLTRFPARRGFEELVMLVSDRNRPFSWTAVTFPKKGYVWFSLKDPRVLQSTILWISNGGRYYAPWSGRHVNVMGLEEVTSYFHLGLLESAKKNPFLKRGFLTTLKLSPQKPLVVNYVMAMARIPAGFDRVVSIRQGKEKDTVILRSASGQSVQTALDLGFLRRRRFL